MLEERVLFSATPLAGLVDGADTASDPAMDPATSSFDLLANEAYSESNSGIHDLQSGMAEVVDGRYQLSPGGAETSLSTLRIESPLPENLQLAVTFNADDISSQFFSNAFIVFDYQSMTDFKFAGAHVGVDEWVIGHVDAIGYHFDDVLNAPIDALTDYELGLTIIDDSTVTLYANGSAQITRTYGESIADGQLGLATRNAVSRFDDLSVRALSVDEHSSPGTAPLTEDFDDGEAEHFSPTSGTWMLVDAAYQVSPEVGGDGISLIHLTDGLSDEAEIGVTFNADEMMGDRFSNGFIIFDYQDENNFKYAGGYIQRNEWAIGHRTSDGWIDDVVVTSQLDPFIDHEMRLVFNGATDVSLFHGEIEVASNSYIDDVTDGTIGLATRNSVTRFDNFNVIDPVVASEVQAALEGENLVVRGNSDGLIQIVAVDNDEFEILDRGRVVSTVSNVTGELRIELGESTDQVLIDLGGNTFDHNISVTLGGGDDSFEITNGAIGGRLNVRSGSGSDDITIADDVSIKKHTKIRMGAGDDKLSFEGSSKRSMFVRAGAGDDALEISGKIGFGLFAKTGSGDDRVDIESNANLGKKTVLDLGHGLDSFSMLAPPHHKILIRDGHDYVGFRGSTDDQRDDEPKRFWKHIHMKSAADIGWKGLSLLQRCRS